MTPPPETGSSPRPLRCATALRVQEQSCEVLAGSRSVSVGYLASFSSPRTERVSPGHLVALATGPTGTAAVVWRWYDAVVLGEDELQARWWELAERCFIDREHGSWHHELDPSNRPAGRIWPAGWRSRAPPCPSACPVPSRRRCSISSGGGSSTGATSTR